MGKEAVMKPTVSVIVPVYQVEDYLWSCLDSLSAQTQEGIEILLIDDGSTDLSGRICDQYADADGRFRCFHTENRGLSAARNLGIGQAEGQYLMFADSDDWVEKDFCESALRCARENAADLVIFPRYMHGFAPGKEGPTLSQGLVSKEAALEFCLNGSSAVWRSLYDRTLFENVRFPEGRLYEDIATYYKLIWKAQRIYYLDRKLYHYRYRRASLSHEETHQRNRDYYLMGMQRLSDLHSWGYSPAKMEERALRLSLRYCRTVEERDDVWMRAAETVRKYAGSPVELSEKERQTLQALCDTDS
ncbi:MAG: glycosyltransferase family 2 protein [Oscillospiraceae bacterium]|nr:glycosyltransferase family 2 protein [Oscillospiraceae bacterium]